MDAYKLSTMSSQSGTSGQSGSGTYDDSVLKDIDVGVIVAAKNHNHSGTYEPADATILKEADLWGSSSNLFVGEDAGSSLTTGTGNTFAGYNAGFSITSGNNNTFVGEDAGQLDDSGSSLTTTESSICIGYDTRCLADGGTNEIVIGYQSVGHGSNTTTIGNDSTTSTVVYGAVSVPEGLKETVYRMAPSEVDISPSNGTIQSKTLTADYTPTFSLTAGQSVLLTLVDADSYTVTWSNVDRWYGTEPADFSGDLTGDDAFVFWHDGTNLCASYAGGYSA